MGGGAGARTKALDRSKGRSPHTTQLDPPLASSSPSVSLAQASRALYPSENRLTSGKVSRPTSTLSGSLGRPRQFQPLTSSWRVPPPLPNVTPTRWLHLKLARPLYMMPILVQLSQQCRAKAKMEEQARVAPSRLGAKGREAGGTGRRQSAAALGLGCSSQYGFHCDEDDIEVLIRC